ncbi:MAG: hypothetical protein KF810_13835 [Rhizobiaceae bacterium]|nr:hypothetical protein [Rhizobiaceae bacterium]
MPASLKFRKLRHVETAVDALDGMESELRQLAGLVVALRILGEAGDAIEPPAISSIARSAADTLDEIDKSWRQAIAALRGA